ncbi:hypothetical protein J2I47_11075, partial [Fibrella sp. HMF5335]
MVINIYSPTLCRHLFLAILLFVLAQVSASAQISGTVFRDFNANGVRETPNEIGVGGVTVTVVSTNNVITTATTSTAVASLGSYTVTAGGTAPYRVQFSNLPTGYFPGPKGTDSGTPLQFNVAANSTNVSLGVNYPTDYSQYNPNFLVPCYVNGDPTSTTGTARNEGVLVSLPYGSVGNTPVESIVATNNQVGTVFGIAYQRVAKHVYTSAFIKRHSGLGPGGAGAIYLTKPTSPGSTSYTSSLFATLPISVSVASNTARGLPSSTTAVNQDPTVFDQVGKTGLGDLEMSEDGTQLYAMNLSDRRLYVIPINNPTSTTPTANTAGITSFSITPSAGACRTGSVFRPFALKTYRGKVYVGGVCTNEAVTGTTTYTAASSSTTTPNLITRDTTGMKAVIYEFDPTNNSFTGVLGFSLNYKKGATNNDKTGVDRADRWLPWTDIIPATGSTPNRFARADLPNASYPQAMLTGIEFDTDGAMIIGIRDRSGDQFGNNNYGTNNTTQYRIIAPGDLLRAGKCSPTASLWTMESNATVCGVSSVSGVNNGQGFGNGEFYWSDAIAIPNTTSPYHNEMVQGGLISLPGSGEVASVVLDPTDQIDSGGIRRFKNSDGSGSPATSTQIFVSSNVATYGKANGLGDLELAFDPAPIEIGNRVWNDGTAQTADGLQGASATSLSAVTVQLYQNGTLLSTTVTNGTGEYYFNNSNVTGGLQPNTAYEIRIPLSQTALSGPGYVPTLYKAGTDNTIDNDGLQVGGNSVIALTTGNYGENNHTYDFGFVTCPTITNPSGPVSVCSGTSINSLTVTTTATGANSIQFVYFTTPQSGTAMYSGGTSLSTATPASGTAGISNVAFPANNTAAPITYYVYAIINPAPGPSDCRPFAQIQVTINPAVSVTVTGNPSLTICNGTSTTLTANAFGGSGFTYRWNTGATTASIPVSPTVTTGYSVTVTNNTGCFSTTSATVTVNPAVTVTASASPATICNGASSTLTATASGGTGLTYLWSNGATTASQSVSPTVTTAYSVTATNSAGCASTATTTITVNPAVTATVASQTICNGTSATLTANASGGSGFTYAWAPTGTGSTQSVVVSPTTTTTYSVTVTNSNGCSALTSATVTVNPAVTATLSSATICNGTSATLTATGGTSYSFSNGTTNTTGTLIVAPNTTTTYSVTVTNANGCSAIASGTVTVNPAVTATIAASPSLTICNGTSTTLTASGGTGYVWSTGATTASIAVSPTTTTTYNVTVTNASGCSALTSATVTVNPAVTATIAASPSLTICNGTSTTLTASGGTAFRWSTGATTASIPVSPTTTTTYSVTVSNASGCSAVTSATVTVNPAVTATLSSATICNGTSATLTATGGTSYSFSNGTNNTTGTLVVSPSTTTIYSVTVTNANGCSAIASGTVTVNPAVTATVASQTICNGTSATLTANASGGSGFTYAWAPTGTGNTQSVVVSPTTTTTYSVTVTNSNGCSALTSATVTVNPAVTATLSSATICNGTSATLTATGGTSYSFSNGTSNTTGTLIVAPNTTTIYSVTVSNANGCSAIASGTVTVNPAVTATIAASPSTTICNGTSATLTASGGTTYRWSTGTTTASITVAPTSSTVYSVTVSNTSGCSAVTSTTITVNPAVTATLNS